MIPSSCLQITPKGVEEIKRRTYRLDMKKRSLLILLERPQLVEYLATKTVLPQEEFTVAINLLLAEGFLSVVSGASSDVTDAAVAQRMPGGSRTAPEPSIYLGNGIVLSEARFLLTNYCVDSFGTDAQSHVAAIRQCKDVTELRHQLAAIYASTERICPHRINALREIIHEINATG